MSVFTTRMSWIQSVTLYHSYWISRYTLCLEYTATKRGFFLRIPECLRPPALHGTTCKNEGGVAHVCGS